MEGVLVVIDRLGRTVAHFEEENASLRAQIEALGRELAERSSASPVPLHNADQGRDDSP